MSDLPLVDALRRLNGAAIAASFEVVCLLRAGYPDGAFARWRAVHEAAVLGTFIRMTGSETASRFLTHDVIATVTEMTEYYKFLGDDLPQDEGTADLLLIQDTLLERYGKSFASRYGWAAHLIHHKQPSFSMIAAYVDMERWEYTYGLASSTIHPRSRSTSSIVSRLMGHGATLVGPRGLGLATPAVMTIRSLMQSTMTLVGLGLTYGHVDANEVTPVRQLGAFACDAIFSCAQHEFVSFQSPDLLTNPAVEDPNRDQDELRTRVAVLRSFGLLQRALDVIDGYGDAPPGPAVRADRATILALLGRKREALEEANRSVAEGITVEGVSIRAMLLIDMDELEAAGPDLDIALTLAPDNEELQKLKLKLDYPDQVMLMFVDGEPTYPEPDV